MRKIMQAASIEVLRVCTFTLYGSQTPSSFMSVRAPVSPSMPQVEPGEGRKVEDGCLRFVQEGIALYDKCKC
jgi:hypothetical protein